MKVMPALLLAGLLAACFTATRPDGQKGLLATGSSAPALTATDHRGESVSLTAGTPTLVYFYPKDGTPGCTKEACALRDAWESYQKAALRVVGVSSDSNESHRKFAEEHGLPFALIADTDNAWAKAFGVGSFAGMDARVSFLIDANNKVVKVYEDVDPGVHAAEVLKDAQALGLTQPSSPNDTQK
jgi:peroxiredoxin Q/BCP